MIGYWFPLLFWLFFQRMDRYECTWMYEILQSFVKCSNTLRKYSNQKKRGSNKRRHIFEVDTKLVWATMPGWYSTSSSALYCAPTWLPWRQTCSHQSIGASQSFTWILRGQLLNFARVNYKIKLIAKGSLLKMILSSQFS